MTANDAGPLAVSYPTHNVLNQPPPRIDINEYTMNVPLCEYVQTIGEASATGDQGMGSALEVTGAAVGPAHFQEDARLV